MKQMTHFFFGRWEPDFKGFKIFVYTLDIQIQDGEESDCFETGLKFLWNLLGARYCVSGVKTSL